MIERITRTSSIIHSHDCARIVAVIAKENVLLIEGVPVEDGHKVILVPQYLQILVGIDLSVCNGLLVYDYIEFSSRVVVFILRNKRFFIRTGYRNQ